MDWAANSFEYIQFECSYFVRSSRNKTTERWRSSLDDGCEDWCTAIVVHTHIRTAHGVHSVKFTYTNNAWLRDRAKERLLLLLLLLATFALNIIHSFIDNYACAMHTTVIIQHFGLNAAFCHISNTQKAELWLLFFNHYYLSPSFRCSRTTLILCRVITVTSIRRNKREEKNKIINEKLIECGIKMKIKTSEVNDPPSCLCLSLKNIVYSIQSNTTMFVCIVWKLAAQI